MEKTYIYIISNPAFKGWNKIGKTTDLLARLSCYQTGDPYRAYKLEYYMEVKDANIHEEHFRNISDDINGEWIKLSLHKIIKMIHKLEFREEAPYMFDKSLRVSHSTKKNVYTKK